MTKVVGITGGIGSGKTTVTEYLRKKGFCIHESDKVVSKIYNKPTKSFISFLKKNVSEDVVRHNKINKKKISDIVFNNEEARKRLEKYTHSIVKTSRDNFIKKNCKNKKGAIFIDIPLLLESGLEKNFDLILSVIAKKKIRTARILKKKKFTKKNLLKIFKIQTSDRERKKKSHIIINNNKTKKDFIFSIEKALIEIIKWEKL